MNECVWLQQLELGDEQAYRILFKEYYSRLSLFANRYIDNKLFVEDIVQDVLYEFCLKGKHFETVIGLKAYLYSAIRNRCLDDIRRQKVHQKFLKEQLVDSEDEFFLYQILEQETYQLLKDAINQLPEQIREIYRLILSGKDNQTIAKVLNLSIDSVKSYKKRGKKLLRTTLPETIFTILFTYIKIE